MPSILNTAFVDSDAIASAASDVATAITEAVGNISMTHEQYHDLPDNEYRVVEFYAESCPHCVSTKPKYEEAAQTWDNLIGDMKASGKNTITVHKPVVADASGEAGGEANGDSVEQQEEEEVELPLPNLKFEKAQCSAENWTEGKDAELCQKEGIQGFPTIKMFGPHGEEVTYKGNREPADMLNSVKFFSKVDENAIDEENPMHPKYVDYYGEIQKLLPTTPLPEHVAPEQNTIIEYFAGACPHCKNLKPEWEKAVQEFQDEFKDQNEGDSTAFKDLKWEQKQCADEKWENGSSFEDCMREGIQGFPTIKFESKSGVVHELQPTRKITSEDLKDFAKNEMSNLEESEKQMVVDKEKLNGMIDVLRVRHEKKMAERMAEMEKQKAAEEANKAAEEANKAAEEPQVAASETEETADATTEDAASPAAEEPTTTEEPAAPAEDAPATEDSAPATEEPTAAAVDTNATEATPEDSAAAEQPPVETSPPAPEETAVAKTESASDIWVKDFGDQLISNPNLKEGLNSVQDFLSRYDTLTDLEKQELGKNVLDFAHGGSKQILEHPKETLESVNEMASIFTGAPTLDWSGPGIQKMLDEVMGIVNTTAPMVEGSLAAAGVGGGSTKGVVKNALDMLGLGGGDSSVPAVEEGNMMGNDNNNDNIAQYDLDSLNTGDADDDMPMDVEGGDNSEEVGAPAPLSDTATETQIPVAMASMVGSEYGLTALAVGSQIIGGSAAATVATVGGASVFF